MSQSVGDALHRRRIEAHRYGWRWAIAWRAAESKGLPAMHRLFVSEAALPRVSSDNPAAGRAGGSPQPPTRTRALPVSYEPRSARAPTAPAAGREKPARKSRKKRSGPD